MYLDHRPTFGLKMHVEPLLLNVNLAARFKFALSEKFSKITNTFWPDT